jgi:hypothetical protein
MSEHEHVWRIRLASVDEYPYYWFECKDCGIQLSGKSVIEKLNEHAVLKRYANKLADGLPEGMLPKDVELIKDANARMETTILNMKSIVWESISPYVASEDVVYGEGEMAALCEGVLTKMWDALLEASHEG